MVNNKRTIAKKSNGRKKVQKIQPSLPDDILINITSRLPTKDVLQWRCVSTFFRDTTSTLEFNELHFKNIIPMIVVENGTSIRGDKINLFLDKWWEPNRSNAINHRFQTGDDKIEFSQEGFLVLKTNSGFSIYNPVTLYEVKIGFRHHNSIKNDVFGIFWHPKLKQYCTILMGTLNAHHQVMFRFQGLESDLSLKGIIETPFDLRICSIENSVPILVGGNMYRFVLFPDDTKQILKYEINNDKGFFTVITCPVAVQFSKNSDLLNMDGFLRVVQISSDIPTTDALEIKIWTLNDGKRHKWDCCSFRISSLVLPGPGCIPKAIGYHDGKLVYVLNKAVFVADLKKGRSMLFGRKEYKKATYFGTHLVSLASLRDINSADIV